MHSVKSDKILDMYYRDHKKAPQEEVVSRNYRLKDIIVMSVWTEMDQNKYGYVTPEKGHLGCLR